MDGTPRLQLLARSRSQGRPPETQQETAGRSLTHLKAGKVPEKAEEGVRCGGPRVGGPGAEGPAGRQCARAAPAFVPAAAPEDPQRACAPEAARREGRGGRGGAPPWPYLPAFSASIAGCRSRGRLLLPRKRATGRCRIVAEVQRYNNQRLGPDGRQNWGRG